MKEKITIIGAGSWGTTLGVIWARKGIAVQLYSIFDEHNAAMSRHRENRLFLKGTPFPDRLTVNPCLEDALSNRIIVFAVPVQFMRSAVERIKDADCRLSRQAVFVSVAKGIEGNTFCMPTRIISDELGKVKVAALSGPTIAKEVLAGVPTACVLACRSHIEAANLQKLFSTEHFRVYSHRDITGVELGGALKNVVAIACGIADGLGLGTNTKAALMTRGLVEIARLGKVLGACVATFSGISGLGDLATTCFSPHSRNRFVGEQIGKGRKVESVLSGMKMVAEGVATAHATCLLARKLKVDMPITREVDSVLFRNKRPEKAVQALMARPLKSEGIY